MADRLPPLVEPGPELMPGQLTRYSRHLLLPGLGMTGQRRLRRARVAVVGAGGLGSPALIYLAAAGVGHLTVLDHDVVDVTNLQRQVLHRDADIGTSKADSAVRAVRALNPDVEIVGRDVELTADNVLELLAGHDIVLDGSDNFTTRYVVNDACMTLGLPLVWAAVLRFDAQVTTFLPVRLGGAGAVQLRDLFPTPPRPEDVPSCAEAGVLGAMVGQVGSIMAAEAVKLIVGIGDPLVGRVLLLDALTQRVREIPLQPGGAAVSGAMPERGTSREVVALPSLTPEQVAELVAADAARAPGRRGGWALVDVREPGEHALGMVPGARPIPVGEVLAWDDLASLDAESVVLYCKSGPRAERAARHLIHLGHRDVRVMDGGMLAWIERVDPSLPTY